VSLYVAQLRADTPGCEEIIHLNNAGAALSPRSVTNAVTDHLRLESQLGGYEAAEAAADKLMHTRSSIAQLLSVGAADIALSHSDTSAWTKAFWGLALAGWFSSGGTVLVDSGVYNSHYFALLQAQQLFDLQIELMQLNEN
jgi:selenocysteine lyase/cysteine desulfurase